MDRGTLPRNPRVGINASRVCGLFGRTANGIAVSSFLHQRPAGIWYFGRMRFDGEVISTLGISRGLPLRQFFFEIWDSKR